MQKGNKQSGVEINSIPDVVMGSCALANVVAVEQVVIVLVVVISVLHISVLVKKGINEQNYSHF